MTDTPHLSEGQQSRPSQPTVRMNGAILRRCPPLPVGNQGTAAKNAAVPVPINAPFVKEKGNSITCAEEYREHIEYAFRGFCKVVLLSAAIHAARAGSGKDKPEISLEYLLAKSVVLQACLLYTSSGSSAHACLPGRHTRPGCRLSLIHI